MTAPGITKILGFIREEQKIIPSFNKFEIREVCRVVMNNASDTGIHLVEYLPSYTSGAGDTTFNPLQLTFTLLVSPHPKTNNLLLVSCEGISKVGESGNIWDIELTYSNYIENEQQKIDQFNLTAIVNPLNRPVVWSTSSSIVQKQTYTDADGNWIIHENGQPLTDPITIEETHTSHTFNFVVNYNSLNYYSNIASFAGLVGTGTVFGVDGQYWKITAASGNEKTETLGAGPTKQKFHYVEVSLTFEYNPSGWVNDAKIVSMSTQQKVLGNYIPIDINENGDRAQAPWPLLPAEPNGDCYGAPYDALVADDFAELNTGYPRRGNIGALISQYGLAIP